MSNLTEAEVLSACPPLHDGDDPATEDGTIERDTDIDELLAAFHAQAEAGLPLMRT